MNNIIDSLVSRLTELSEEHQTIVTYLEKQTSSVEELEKDLKVKIGMLTIKCTYLESSMYTISSILKNELEQDIETLLTKPQQDFYYMYAKHLLPSLHLQGDKVETSEEVENFLKTLTLKK